VEEAAGELEIPLPENWLDPESREGVFEDPEREAWREYADTTAKDAEEGEPGTAMAEALRRMMEESKKSE
jgi:hypothetical protein